MLPTAHPERSEGCFVGKIGRGTHGYWLSIIYNFPEKSLYTILSSFEMQMRELFHQGTLCNLSSLS